MLATSAISEVQTQAMPNMTLPATICAGSVPIENSRMHQSHAPAATADTMKISSELCPRENPAGLIEKLLSPEFLGIRLNLVEEVAAVATRLLRRDPVDGRRLLRDLDARIRQPRGDLIGCADAKTVGGAVDAQDESSGDQTVLEGANARRLGVKTHPRVVDPAHDCS